MNEKLKKGLFGIAPEDYAKHFAWMGFKRGRLDAKEIKCLYEVIDLLEEHIPNCNDVLLDLVTTFGDPDEFEREILRTYGEEFFDEVD